MTTIPPAEPRPPPRHRDPDTAHPSPIQAWNTTGVLARTAEEPGLSSPLSAEEISDRPAKRRKIESHNNLRSQSADESTQAQEQDYTKGDNAKRRLVGDIKLLTAILRDDGQDNIPSNKPINPSTLPMRPWAIARNAKVVEEPKPTHRSRAILPVPTTPDTLGEPKGVPCLVNNKPAGYFPWTGRHLEDILNDNNVKQGYSDRPPNPPEKELNTARVPLYNAFKHRSGVDSLSTLFSLVLDAKSKHDRISSITTFKPPPRVTLTEAKRKSWISDLADADVPLRKLSRTIPQGIRGQILLDQCLQNNIPLGRAIWFTKCVGANEIRTLKRKGTTPAAALGTEMKWLREWTTNIQQFIESILVQCGQTQWKTKVQYALRLTTRLYHENLMDRDFYLQWMTKSFAACNSEQIPFWLMFVYIYKHDLLKFRPLGKRIIETLLQTLTLVDTATNDDSLSLRAKLKATLCDLVNLRPLCLLLPDQWPEVFAMVESCLAKSPSHEQRLLYEQLAKKNERCMGSRKRAFSAKTPLRDAVLQILDNSHATLDFKSLADRLIAVQEHFEPLALTCLEWATTRFRTGEARIYLVLRLLRKWHSQDYDVGSPILNFIARCNDSSHIWNITAVRRLVADLSRSRTFPISKYLQWLTVRGLPRPGDMESDQRPLSSDTDQAQPQEPVIKPKSSIQTLLLTDLCLTNSGDHLMNLRNSMLARAGYTPEVEARTADTFVQLLLRKISEVDEISYREPLLDWESIGYLEGLDWSVRYRISYQLRSYVAQLIRNFTTLPPSKTILQDADPVSDVQFRSLRTAFEQLKDVAVLADIVGLLSLSVAEDLLASLVETLSRHSRTFCAIGAFEPLQTKICQRYLSLRSTKPTMPLLALSLNDLCSKFPSKVISVKLLQQDFVRGDRGRAIAACSPFSDGIAESLQQAEATFIEDFEAVLQSEPSMTEQTMSRLFAVLAERIGKQQNLKEDEVDLFILCQLLTRLGLCRKTQSEALLKSWLFKLLGSSGTGFARKLICALVKAGSISTDSLVSGITELKDDSATRKAIMAVIQPWLSSSPASIDYAIHDYSVATKWADFVARRSFDVALLLCEANIANIPSDEDHTLITRIVLDHSKTAIQAAVPVQSLLVDQLDDVFQVKSQTETGITEYFQFMDYLSAPFIRLRMSLSDQESTSMSSDLSTAISDLLHDVLNSTSQGPSAGRLSRLVQCVGPEIASSVRHQAEQQVIELLPKLVASRTPTISSINEEELAKASAAVDQLFDLCVEPSAPDAKILAQLSERVSSYLKYLSSLSGSTSTPVLVTSPTAVQPPGPVVAIHQITPLNDLPTRQLPSSMIDYLDALLRLLCLQRSVPAAPSDNTNSTSNVPFNVVHQLPPKPIQNELVKVLTMLTSIVTNSAYVSMASFTKDDQARASETIDFAHDVMTSLVDEISEDHRQLCARLLRDKLQNDNQQAMGKNAGRLRWLFGNVNNLGSDLHGAEAVGKGLLMTKEGRGILGEWKPRIWEIMETGGSANVKDTDSCLGLGLFGARRV